MTNRYFIFGAGYSGRAFGRLAAGEAQIDGTSRSEDKFDRLLKAGIEPYAFDGKTVADAVRLALTMTTHLVISAAPTEAGDPVLAVAREALLAETPRLRWVGYLSTVGVYGDHGGAWVDETSECRPVSRRSTLRVAAERDWIGFGHERGVPLAVLRLSGIYGPGRNAFVNLEKGTARRLVKPGQVFNRIHVADIAGALKHLSRSATGGIFNITDDEPAPPQDVIAYAAKRMGIEPPPEIPFETAQISPMARSFYGENKRVSNLAVKAAGYRFAFPNYHAALDAMWAADDWRGEGEADAASPMSA
ncbi:SDR family oxidoreductase [Mesorhizobium sp. BAC0120]|uniref:SDR family oxidoreductase n=1 Tax=Mesorhizobium sp. BAC0120 TaxID=3090670 RepID=UPI00298CFA67|nr:SDR family oxidoreductase [Mesorhizobium sp. BAC0120]MDW6024597.1 SDR family oxidoreductase [Mesorhizobium sp. BAC0120]